MAAIILITQQMANAAPDEDALGKSRGYPTSRSSWDEKPYRIGNYSHLASVFPYNTVAGADIVRKLVPTMNISDSDALSAGLKARLSAYLDQFPVTGLLVLKNEKILFEAYQYDRKPSDLFHGWSMSKSVLGLLVGAAIQDGLIASINDKAEKYLPELAGTLHGSTKIKDLLQMSTGAAVLHKVRSEGGDLSTIYTELLSSNSDSFSLVKHWNARAESAGSRFNYNELAPLTLTHIVRRVTGKSLSAYLEQKIWKPMGAESSATWMRDSKGAENGQHQDTSIISKDWLLKATTVASEDRHLAPKIATSHSGYGYLTWVEAYKQRHVFSMRGHHNQYVIVAPDLKLVLVQTSVSEDSNELPKNLYGIFTALMSEMEKKK